jgi:sigma-B regulation protein RsbU (phosphoserine phosphatase)
MTDALVNMKRKELALSSLLEITQAINNNLPEEALYKIYHFTLRGNLNIQRLALFVAEEGHWACKAFFGVAAQVIAQPFALALFAEAKDIGPLSSAQKEAGFADFELLIPIYHKQSLLALVLASPTRQEEIDTSFVQTLTNIIIVAIENKKLAKKQVQQELFQKELAIARQVQQRLFPKHLPNSPQLQAEAYYQPHSSVGGDYYDFIRLSEEEFLFCIADVSGKGMAAALMMSNFQASLRTLARQTKDLVAMVEELNYLLHDTTEGEHFITFFVAIYHRQEGRLSYINAGHNPPLLLFPQGELQKLEKGTTVLGIFSPLPFIEKAELQVPGSFLLFSYTDGLNETINEADEQFGDERLMDFLHRHAHHSPAALQKALIAELQDFKGSMPYSDDITLFLLKAEA